ncbi:MAG: efflux RND transporter permease subunit [Bacteroidales bacterium]|nr:efflux RND transporter permease subunit [Bacteroidales bacterium]
MKIIAFFYHRPVAVSMFFLALVLLGIISAFKIPVTLLPEIPIGKISIKVEAPEYSSRKIEDEITRNLRLQLLQLNNTTEINSTTRNNVSQLELSFPFGTDMEMAFIEVNEQIDRFLPMLPKNIERPKVMHSKANDIPIFYLNLTPKENNLEELEKLNTFAKNVLVRRLEQLKGIAFVDISGINQTEILIRKNKAKCSVLGITNKDIELAIGSILSKSKNIKLERNNQEYNIQFQSPIQNINDLNDVIITKEKFRIPISEICSIEKKIKAPDGYCISNGKQTISLAVICQSSSRISKLKKDIQKLINEQQQTYPQLQFELINDQSKLLNITISNLLQSLLVGFFLVLIVVFIFIPNKNLSLLIGFSIPISLLICLFFFDLFHISINIISLSGLILGIGMMIDNAIIVIDNINRKYEKTNNLFLSTTQGTSEIFSALLSSALTTTCIFIPLIFLSGISGALFHDQAIAIATGLFVSLGVSCILLPVWYKKIDPTPNTKSTSINKWFLNLYEKGFLFLSKRQKTLAVTSGLLIIIGIGGIMTLKRETMPKITRLNSLIHINWNEEITSSENKRRTTELHKLLNKYTSNQLSWVGRQQYILGHIQEQSPKETRTFLSFEKKQDKQQAIYELNKIITSQYPIAIVKNEIVPNLFDFIFSKKDPDLKLKLYYNNPEIAKPNKIKPLYNQIDSLFANEKKLINPTQTTISYKLNPKKLNLYKINYSSIIDQIKYNLTKYKINKFAEGKDIFDIVLDNNSEYTNNWADTFYIKNEKGDAFSLKKLGQQQQITEWEQITADKSGEYLPYEIHDLHTVNIPRNKLNQLFINNSNWHLGISGNANQKSSLAKEMLIILIISVLLLYFILAAQFESLTQPLIILLELPINLSGIFLILSISHSSLNILSMIGIVVMVGIVINDSILKVDTINRFIAEGSKPNEAIHQAGLIRLRPILMTSLTTILALTPFLFGNGIGNEIQKPLSLVIIGGLGLGTIVSSLFVPFFYKWLLNISSKK